VSPYGHPCSRPTTARVSPWRSAGLRENCAQAEAFRCCRSACGSCTSTVAWTTRRS
jgi:hypothetical protein